VKTDINAVTVGQEELRNDINTAKVNMSALETKINAGQEELRQEINAFQERIRNIEAGQAEFEERITCTVDTQLRNMSFMVVQQMCNLREDLSRNIEVTRQDFETQLADLEARTRRAGGSSAGANIDKVKPSKFDGSTSWVVFQSQFEAANVHNVWTPGVKAAQFLSVMQGQAAHVLHSVPAEASYEDIVGALRDLFGDHQLAAAYRSHLKVRVQTCGETLQEFAAAVEQLAHRALVELPVDHIQTEAAHAFINGIRDREVKQHLLLGKRMSLGKGQDNNGYIESG
jgi:hypothetical protein